MNRTVPQKPQNERAGKRNIIRIIRDDFAGLKQVSNVVFLNPALKHALNGMSGKHNTIAIHTPPSNNYHERYAIWRREYKTDFIKG